MSQLEQNLLVFALPFAMTVGVIIFGNARNMYRNRKN